MESHYASLLSRSNSNTNSNSNSKCNDRINDTKRKRDSQTSISKKVTYPTSSSTSSQSSSITTASSPSSTNPTTPTSSSWTEQPTIVSILIDPRSSSSSNSSSSGRGTCRLAVTSCQPRSRSGTNDGIRRTIRHYAFQDDNRGFRNLDALMTRLTFRTIGTVIVACVDSTKEDGKSGSSGNDRSNQIRISKAREASKLLKRVQNLLENTLTSSSSSSTSPHPPNIKIIPTLPTDISNSSRRTILLQKTLRQILGGESSKQYHTYRGDKILAEDTLVQRSVGLLVLTSPLRGGGNNNINMAAVDQDDNDGDEVDGGGSSNTTHGVASRGGGYEILPGRIDSHLVLDGTAASTVNLLPPRHAGVASMAGITNSNDGSLLGILDKCKTVMGSRMMETWLRQPLVNLEEIHKRQGAVAAMVEGNGGMRARDRLRDEGVGSFRGMDLDRLCRMLEGCILVDDDGADGDQNQNGAAANDGIKLIGGTGKALESMYKLWLVADKHLPAILECTEDLVRSMIEDDNGGENIVGDVTKPATSSTSSSTLPAILLEELKRVSAELCRSADLVECVLDFDRAPREYVVRTSFDKDIADLRCDLDNIDEELKGMHEAMDKIWAEVGGCGPNKVKIEGTDGAVGGECAWQFRILDSNATKIVQGGRLGNVRVTCHRVLKNGVYFSTADLRDLGCRKFDLLAEYEERQRDIVKNAASVAVTYVPVLERLSELVGEIDALASLAHVAAMNPNGYCRPVLTDGEEDGMGIMLEEARHPCVELQEDVDFIANNIELTFGSSSFLLVTGPNMGGKSTYIRSLAAICIMAQIGSYVPCKSAIINIVHHILARVGAGDLQDRGISTFMAEMLEASSILRTATKRSLIVIDELGRGTSTFDGYGLALAISEHIVQNIGCMTVFATHFHELTALEGQEKEIKNCHVSARASGGGSNQLTFLYEVQPGPCLESFGIQVAEMANVPPSVIENAKIKAKQLENFGYRKNIRRGGNSVGADIENEGDQNNHGSDCNPSNDDEELAAIDFLRKFRDLPLSSLATDEEKQQVMSNVLKGC